MLVSEEYQTDTPDTRLILAEQFADEFKPPFISHPKRSNRREGWMCVICRDTLVITSHGIAHVIRLRSHAAPPARTARGSIRVRGP